ncbi:hypothetical protein ABMA28_006021 [Loxostege sticticalis]|uniref:Gustatory receptor n=1 Tax=Loxostege sticticalis TaxID=481309 RepID=A0ABD0SJR5_LOXSC
MNSSKDKASSRNMAKNAFQKCYLMLTEQNNYINQVFGVRVMIMILLTSLSALEFVILLFNLIYRCEKAYERRDDIISILDHVLVDKYINPLKKETLLDLRSLVYSRPIQFTAANFYRLEYSLLVAFCSVLTTYTIILMQNQKL